MNTFGNLGDAVGPMLVGFYLDLGHSWNIPLLTLVFLLSLFRSMLAWNQVGRTNSVVVHRLASTSL